MADDERIRATYRIETSHDPHAAADAMAGEQSSGTFVDVPGETEALKERHAARVEAVEELETVDEPTLPGTSPPDGGDPADAPREYARARVTLSFPYENVGPSLPNLLTTVAGNLFELRHFSGLRLLDVEVPSAIAEAYPGPQFGIEGTREIVDVYDRPIIGTIVKPSVGLSPADTADIVETMVESGLDFVKDDELIADPPYSPVEDRVAAVMDVIDDHGADVMYACNVTGDVDEMLERHDRVVEAGGNCVMVSMNSVGLAGVARLREAAEVPIHGHRNGWGALSRCPQLGFDYGAYQTFFRLAGVDHFHVNGLRNKFCESDESVIASAKAVQTPVAGEDRVGMPVFSSGQWAGQAPDTYEALGNADLMYVCGGGIMGHPDGPAAGVEHLKQGWEAAMAGIPLAEYAEDHEELRRGIERFGPVGSGR
jgi:ribulose-bisphosphate carboxylase large chain